MKTKKNRKNRKVLIVMPVSLIHGLDKLARSRGTSRCETIRAALEFGLTRQGSKHVKNVDKYAGRTAA